MGTQQSDFAWRIGGPQGSGVDTAAGLFARACAIGGLHLFGRGGILLEHHGSAQLL
jgi:Pyruvate/2-oxoacid:ferredoxin oxidoreductase gamma subunit